MFSGTHVAAFDQQIERFTHRVNCGVEPLHLRLDIFGDKLFDDDARLMQDNASKPDAVGDRSPLQGERPAERDVPARRGQRLQFARSDHFGEQHGRRLECLDLLFGIGAACLVLDDQYAERIAAAQDRHAEERRIDFLAGFRPVHERRVRLRVGKRERLGGLGNQADETFARA